MQTVYSYTYIAPLALLHQLSTTIGMLLFLLLCFGISWAKQPEDRAGRIITRVIIYPIMLLFVVVALMMGCERFQHWQQMHEQITSGQMQVAEGIVTDYDYEQARKRNGTRDDFYVDGVHFVYGSTDLTVPVGYRKNAMVGGYIRGDGQYVRISYITLDTGRNVILRIEAPADN